MKRLVRSILLLALCMILVGCGSETSDNRIKMPASSSDFEGTHYLEVSDTLESAGFTNVQTEVLKDLVFGWLTKDGEVEKVAVDGDTIFSTDDKYNPDVEITITYHTFEHKPEENESSSEQQETEPIASNEEENTQPVVEQPEDVVSTPEETAKVDTAFSISDVPAYSGNPYVSINGNIPYFEDKELSSDSYEYYSPLDDKGRCGVCIASIGQDLMPTEERGSIGSVKPTGWQTVKYAGIVDGNYLYNRCHLIGFQLSGENANSSNLITGTRYLNVEGMLPFENMVADYVKETGNQVMYRVTPIFEGSNMVASGVLMEAKSIEDSGDGILYNVYCYNIQPGIAINYANGDSQTDGTIAPEEEKGTVVKPASDIMPKPEAPENGGAFVVNPNNGKIHMFGECSATGNGSNAMKNPVYFNTYEEAEAYSISIAPSQDKRKCGNCW